MERVQHEPTFKSLPISDLSALSMDQCHTIMPYPNKGYIIIITKRIPSWEYSKLLYLLMKSLQTVFKINRNLKQIRSLAEDEKIKLNFNNVNIARESLQDARKRIKSVLNEVPERNSSVASFVKLSKLKREIGDIQEINSLLKETYISLQLLLAELKLK
jgi:hypothetical protein